MTIMITIIADIIVKRIASNMYRLIATFLSVQRGLQ